MITDKLKNAHKYYPLSKNIEKGLKFLQENDLKKLANGTYEIDGKNVYISVQEYKTKDISVSKWEAHQKYTDIQYIISGEEKIGFTNLDTLKEVIEYDNERDISFLEGEGYYLCAKEGDFVIFTPDDAHRPSLTISDTPSNVKKAVVKLIY